LKVSKPQIHPQPAALRSHDPSKTLSFNVR